MIVALNYSILPYEMIAKYPEVKNFVSLFLSAYIVIPVFNTDIAFSLCRKAIEKYLTQQIEIECENLPAIFSEKIPVFVSLKRGSQTRGCAGSFQSENGSFAKDLVHFSIIAATQDFRYRPVDLQEMKEIKIQITIPEMPVEIHSIFSYNPEKEGLIVEKDGKQAVVLPGEAKTAAYALKMCLRNAGIDDNSNIRLFKFKAQIFIEEGK